MFEEKKINGKRILFIIGSKNFKDEEYFIPCDVFQKAGATIVTASSILGEIIGVDGGEAQATINLKQVEVELFEAVIFVGGAGASEYFENKDAHRIAQEAVLENKVLGAICIAPVILAKAGVLKGKNATVWSNQLNKSGVKELKIQGCKVGEKRIIIDGNIITANGPAAAKEFAKEIIAVLLGNETKDQ